MQYTAIDALANPVRIKMLCCLSKKSKNVNELIKTCGLAQSAVSQHLVKLKNAGLVKTKRNGKYIYYSLANSKIADVAMQLSGFCKEGVN
jgi:ArsR family transcriptional regulator, virulence genes transcriptional regulator